MNPIMLATFATSSTGAAGAAEALQSGLTAEAFWTGLQPFWTVIIGLTVFAFVYGFVRKLIRNSRKGKSV